MLSIMNSNKYCTNRFEISFKYLRKKEASEQALWSSFVISKHRSVNYVAASFLVD
jgi:hypothetical protein